MSEQQRTNFYNLLREQTDEQTAEFVMSCLAPAPLSDLVTKEHLSAEFSKFALLMSNQRQADREAHAIQREADLKDLAAQREADREAHAIQREADRKERRDDVASLSKRISRLAFWLPIEMLCALAAVVAITEWLRG